MDISNQRADFYIWCLEAAVVFGAAVISICDAFVLGYYMIPNGSGTTYCVLDSICLAISCWKFISRRQRTDGLLNLVILILQSTAPLAKLMWALMVLRLLRFKILSRDFLLVHQFLRKQKSSEVLGYLFLVLYFFAFVFFVCVLGCLWWFISCRGTYDSCQIQGSWITERLSQLDSPSDALLQSIYFVVVTLFTIGFGDIYPQREEQILFSIPLMLFGSALTGLLISLLSSSMRSSNALYINFRNKLSRLTRTMKISNLDETAQAQVLEYKQHLYKSQYDFHEHQLLYSLPPALRKVVKSELLLPSVQHLPMMQHLNTNERLKLLEEMHVLSVPASFKTDIASEDFRALTVIRGGKFSIMSNNEEVTGVDLVVGDAVGDFEYFKKKPFEFGYRSKVPSDIAVLTRAQLDNFTFVCHDSTFQSFVSSSENAYNSRLFRLRAVQNANVKAGAKLGVQSSDPRMKKSQVQDTSPYLKFWKVCWLTVILVLMLFSSLVGIFLLPFTQSDVRFSRGVVTMYSISESFLLVDLFVQLRELYRWFDEHYASNDDAFKSSSMREFLSTHWALVIAIGCHLLSLIPHFAVRLIGFKTLEGFEFTKAFGLAGVYVTLLRLSKEIRSQFSDMPAALEKTMQLVEQSILTIFVTAGFAAGFLALHFHGMQLFLIDSIYWCLTTITTTGYGDIVAASSREVIFSIFVISTGPLVFVNVIAFIVTFVQGVGHEDSVLHKSIVYQQICLVNKSSRSIATLNEEDRAGIILHNQNLLLNQFYERRDKIYFECGIPFECKGWLQQIILTDFLNSSKMLRKCSERFKRDVALIMEQLLIQSDELVNEHNQCHGLYFVKLGILRVGKLGNTFSRKFTGDIVGDEQLFDESSDVQIQTITDCELWFLSASKFRALSSKLQNQLDDGIVRASLGRSGANGTANGRRKNIQAPQTSLGSIIHQYKKRKQWILEPTSFYIQLWSVLVLLSLFSFLIMIPFQFAFGFNKDGQMSLYYISDFILLSDGILRCFFVAHVDERGEMVVDSMAIFKHALKTRMALFFCLVCFPTQLLLIPFQLNNRISAVAYLNRLFRLGFGDLKKKAKNLFSVVPFKSNLARVGVNLFRSFFLILLIAHACGCVFQFISDLEKHFVPDRNTWTSSLICQPDCSVSQLYVASLYWAVAVLATVGYGDITPQTKTEKLFNIFVFCLGTVVLAMIIGSFQQLSTESNFSIDAHMKKAKEVLVFLEREGKLPLGKKKLEKFNQMIWQTSRGLLAQDLINLFDDKLYKDIIQLIFHPNLEETFYIKTCPREFQNSFARLLQVDVYLKDDVLFRNGEAALNLFYLAQGEIILTNSLDETPFLNTVNTSSARPRNSVVSKKSIYTTIYQGLCGEAEFFSRACYSCHGVISADSVVLRVHFDEFWSLIDEFGYRAEYTRYFQKHRVQLSRVSTAMFVQNVDGNFSNKKMMKLLSENIRIDKNSKIFGPESLLAKSWKMTWGLLCVFQICCSPVFAAFPALVSSTSMVIFDSLACLFILIGMYAKLNIMVTHKSSSTGKTSDLESQLHQYGKRAIWWDVLCLMTHVAALLVMGKGEENYFLARSIHIILLPDFFSFLSFVVVDLAKAQKFVFTSVAWIVLLLLFCHFCATFMVMIGNRERDASAFGSWIDANFAETRTSLQCYLTALCWSTYTLTTVGYGSVKIVSTTEKLLAVAMMIIGSIFSANLSTVVGAMVEHYLQQNDLEKSVNHARAKFISGHHISSQVGDQVSNYHRYVEIQLNGISDERIFKQLPRTIQMMFRSEFFDCLINSNIARPIEDTVREPSGWISTIVNFIEPYVAIPSECVLVKNELESSKEIEDIFLFRRGTLRAFWGQSQSRQIAPRQILNDFDPTTSEVGENGLVDSELALTGLVFLPNNFFDKHRVFERLKIVASKRGRKALSWTYRKNDNPGNSFVLEANHQNETKGFEAGMKLDVFVSHSPDSEIFYYLGGGRAIHNERCAEVPRQPSWKLRQSFDFLDEAINVRTRVKAPSLRDTSFSLSRSFAKIYPFSKSCEAYETDNDDDDGDSDGDSLGSAAFIGSVDSMVAKIPIKAADGSIQCVAIFGMKSKAAEAINVEWSLSNSFFGDVMSFGADLKQNDAIKFISEDFSHLMVIRKDCVKKALDFHSQFSKSPLERVRNLSRSRKKS